jgi:hypothetical protein
MLLPILPMLGHPWLDPLFVYSIVGQIGSSSVSPLFSRYIISFRILKWISVTLSCIVNYVYDVSLWYVCVHNFDTKGTYSRMTI